MEGWEESRTGSRETTEDAGAVMEVTEDAASRRVRKVLWSTIQQVLGNLMRGEGGSTVPVDGQVSDQVRDSISVW